jgi:GNAT superfamily N-acetyltransferase
VRPASNTEARSIAALLHDFNTEFGDPSPGAEALGERVARMIEGGATVWLVALDGDRMVGLAQSTLQETVWSDRPVLHLDEFYVVPERRGAGIGRALLAEFIRLGEAREVARYGLETGDVDRAARHLYEQMGFVNRLETEGQMLYYERPSSGP